MSHITSERMTHCSKKINDVIDHQSHFCERELHRNDRLTGRLISYFRRERVIFITLDKMKSLFMFITTCAAEIVNIKDSTWRETMEVNYLVLHKLCSLS